MYGLSGISLNVSAPDVSNDPQTSLLVSNNIKNELKILMEKPITQDLNAINVYFIKIPHVRWTGLDKKCTFYGLP